MTKFSSNALTPMAIEVLGQLYVNGPTWDGNIVSKNGRGDLVRAGLAWHEHGYTQLTTEGVRVAIEWDVRDLKRRGEDNWLKKRRMS